jgi:plastocyanin
MGHFAIIFAATIRTWRADGTRGHVRGAGRSGGEVTPDDDAGGRRRRRAATIAVERNRVLMKKSAALLLPLLLVLVLGAAGCGKGNPGGSTSASNSATVQMTSNNFATTSVNVLAGGTVTFTDPPAGAVHLLCLGQNQTCNSSIKNGPPELSDPNHPLEIDSGTKNVTFPTAGDYQVTCTVHPSMNMTVHVK